MGRRRRDVSLFQGKFVDAVGSDFDNVHGFPVARNGHIVRAAKSLYKIQFK